MAVLVVVDFFCRFNRSLHSAIELRWVLGIFNLGGAGQ
jgi:hypothetical protein